LSNSRLQSILRSLDEVGGAELAVEPSKTEDLPSGDQQALAPFEAEVRRVEAWLAAANGIPPSSPPELRRLARLTERFALSVWAHPAIAGSWSDGELFALEGGLITEFTRRTLHFISISEDGAALMTGRARVEQWPRKPELVDASPWWRELRAL
jgi:hypothetical protein